MSLFQGQSQIFPPTTGGAEAVAKEMGIALLGKIPLDPRLGMCVLALYYFKPIDYFFLVNT